MGLYDGRDGRSEHGSTAQLAKWLSAPVVLVLDCWSLARSAAALVAGFAAFDPGVQVAAVVFNKTGGEAHTAWLRDALDAAHAQPLVLGGIPRDAGVAAAAARPESGSSGHVRAWPWACPHAGGASPEYLHCLAALIDTHLDVDALLNLAAPMPPALLRLGQGPSLAAVLTLPTFAATPNGAASPSSELRTPSGALATSPVDSPSTGPGVRARIAALSAAQSPGSHGTPSGPLSPAGSRPVTPTAEMVGGGGAGSRASPAGGNSGPITPPSFGRVRIGVARDAAFPHVYSTNLALLAEAGAELVFFSPSGGDPLPPRLCGLYLPAGSPDHFAPQLAANSRLRSGVAAFAAGGGVILAECGGMQFLCASLHHPASKTDRGWPMCGVLPVDARLAPRGGTRVGYASVTVLGEDEKQPAVPGLGVRYTPRRGRRLRPGCISASTGHGAPFSRLAPCFPDDAAAPRGGGCAAHPTGLGPWRSGGQLRSAALWQQPRVRSRLCGPVQGGAAGRVCSCCCRRRLRPPLRHRQRHGPRRGCCRPPVGAARHAAA